ncbi:hypothetical protein CsSME_00035465 [Camellia sinensis var. sinensis]
MSNVRLMCNMWSKNRWPNKIALKQVSDKMDPNELVKLIEILNPQNKPGRITIITRMGAENMRVKLPHLIRAVRRAGQIVTWVSDPMHGNTIKAPCGLKTRPFDAIRVKCSLFYFFPFFFLGWIFYSI